MIPKRSYYYWNGAIRDDRMINTGKHDLHPKNPMKHQTNELINFIPNAGPWLIKTAPHHRYTYCQPNGKQPGSRNPLQNDLSYRTISAPLS